MPGHATREVLVLMGSLTTCDPGDINTTIQNCKTANVRCSVISLAAEVRIYRELSKATDGNFAVIMDDVHLRDLLHEHVEPPPSASGAEPALIKMGFPSHASNDPSTPSSGLGLCMCHLDTNSGCKLTTSGFLCPQVFFYIQGEHSNFEHFVPIQKLFFVIARF
jgi:transcription initiation factor TFIIH subunit 2